MKDSKCAVFHVEIWGDDPHHRGPPYILGPEENKITKAVVEVRPVTPCGPFFNYIVKETIEDKIYLLGFFASKRQAEDYAADYAQGRREAFTMAQASYDRNLKKAEGNRD